jgi:hypothetical protein
MNYIYEYLDLGRQASAIFFILTEEALRRGEIFFAYTAFSQAEENDLPNRPAHQSRAAPSFTKSVNRLAKNRRP